MQKAESPVEGQQQKPKKSPTKLAMEKKELNVIIDEKYENEQKQVIKIM